MILSVNKLCSGYGSGLVVRDVSFEMREGEVIGFLGRNGVGKTTLIKTLLGLVKVKSGSITFEGKDITRLPPYQRAHIGIGYVPQGRGIFSKLTVQENLYVGELINRKERRNDKKFYIDLVYRYFPILKERRNQRAATLSGGEQQMLAIGRALVGGPKLLLVDEPSEGIQPSLIHELGEILASLAKERTLSVLLVEQNIDLVEAAVDYSYVMEKGEITARLNKDDLLNKEIISRYLAI